MSIKLVFKLLVVSVLSFVLFGCNKDGAETSGSTSLDDSSHIVVYQDEIYKNWPYQ